MITIALSVTVGVALMVGANERQQSPSDASAGIERSNVGSMPSLDLEAVIRIRVGLADESGILVSGETNLPDDTKLLVFVTEPFSGGFFEQKAVTVEQGVYDGGEFGADGGMADGRFGIDVVTAVPADQPPSVRARIGDAGQKLVGPLRRAGAEGATLRATTEITIGDAAGIEQQQRRFQKKLETWRQVHEQCGVLHESLIRILRSDTDDVQRRIQLRQISSTLELQQTDLDEAGPRGPGLHLASAVAGLRALLLSAGPGPADVAQDRLVREQLAAARQALDTLRRSLTEAESQGAPKPALRTPTVPKLQYSVLKDEAIPGIKRVIEVRLSRSATKDELRAIATKLKHAKPEKYDRTFIFYVLPDWNDSQGAWATTHFDPTLEVRILGLTSDEVAALKNVPPQPSSREILGSWLDDSPMVGCRLTIFRENGRWYMEYTWKGGSSYTAPLIERGTSGGRRFDKPESTFGDHWIIDFRGDLEIRDNDGLITTAKKIK